MSKRRARPLARRANKPYRRLMLRKILLLAAMLFASPAFADILVDNVNGYTIREDGRLFRFEAMWIGDDGRVRQLYQRADARPNRPRFLLNGRGRTLIPGLIDAHGHVMELGMGALELDLSDTNSLAEAQARLRAYAAANPTPRWIVGPRLEPGALASRPLPDRGGARRRRARPAGLAAPGRRPCRLGEQPGDARGERHRGDPVAGRGPDRAQRAAAERRLRRRGQGADRACGAAAAAADPRPRPRPAQEILLSYGVTTAADMGTSAEDWAVMRRAGDAGSLNVRILSYALGIDNLLAIAGQRPTPWLYDTRLRMVGVKLYLDGALGSRGAWLKAPYRDAPGQRGYPLLSDTVLKNLMSRAAMDHFQVAVHAIGDAANAELLSAIEELSDTYNGDRRWRIEHAQIVDPADLPRFGRHSIIASMQPTHETSDWRMAEARMGIERLQGSYAWRSMLDNHVPLAFGSDFPVESPNPFPGIAAAISREDGQGQPPGGWQPQQRLTLEEAFAAFTRGGAYAGFAEDRLGTLEPGHMADFVFIDRDIFDHATPQQIRETHVQETYLAGNKVWERH
jgi:predicted amidohydrolase YtcJ